jgi:light-regulated signal transduction histidine kinase (bacteriophytochrome)
MEQIHEIAERQPLAMILHQVITQIHPDDNVTIIIDEDLPSIVNCGNKLQKVFYQIIKNAIVHNHKKDIQIKIASSIKEGRGYLRIKDNGPGIEHKYHEKVFEIFQTLHRRDEKETMGIGLAITRKIIVDMGGKIRLNSVIGEGSEFEIELPSKYFYLANYNNLPEITVGQESIIY